MSKSTIIELRAERKSLLDQAAGHARAAQDIAASKNGGRLSKDEQTAFDDHYTKATQAKQKADGLDQKITDAEVMETARALADDIGMPLADGGADPVTGRPRAGRRSFGAKAAAVVQRAGAEFGVKALVSGTIDVPNPIEQDVVADPQAPTTFLDLITDRNARITSNTFNFLRQTARTHNAAPVADGALKPTSVYTVEEIEDRVRVVAHLSEPIPERYFADHAELERFLNAEMEAGLLLALEGQVANGDGTGENMTGILRTSGTVAVPFSSDKLVTARKALTALRNLGEQPTAWVLNPVDDEDFDLLRENGATGGYLLDQSEDLWRIPRRTSPQVPAGTAILADWRQARLVTRESVQLAADRSGTNFQKNLVQLRVEGRFGLAVRRPQAFAVVDLAA